MRQAFSLREIIWRETQAVGLEAIRIPISRSQKDSPGDARAHHRALSADSAAEAEPNGPSRQEGMGARTEAKTA
jgi:hypothetical protein